jgi:hypothetical protein
MPEDIELLKSFYQEIADEDVELINFFGQDIGQMKRLQTRFPKLHGWLSDLILVESRVITRLRSEAIYAAETAKKLG